jgi:hypothetical protein
MIGVITKLNIKKMEVGGADLIIQATSITSERTMFLIVANSIGYGETAIRITDVRSSYANVILNLPILCGS